MDAKRFIAGTIVGGIVLFASGYLIFDIVFADFYAANAGTATGVARTPPLLWAMAVGMLAYAALICYAMGPRSAWGLAGGAKVGAVVGFLLWLAADFTLFGTQNVSSLTITLIDPLADAVHGAIGGAAIGLLLAQMKAAP